MTGYELWGSGFHDADAVVPHIYACHVIWSTETDRFLSKPCGFILFILIKIPVYTEYSF